MAEISNKKKCMIISLIAALIIVIFVTVVLMVLGGKRTGNTENSKNREVYSEEEILDKCIEAINEGDGKWLTYCEACHSDEAIEFLEYYYEVCDEYGWEEVSGNKCKNIVENGYKEDFRSLKQLFGGEYKITYSIKNKEKVDRDSVDIEDVEYGGASNVDADYISGNYAENLENRLTHIGVPEKTIEKCTDLYSETYGINKKISELYKAEVAFTVSGTREITFTDEIWFGKVGGRLVPFEYIEMWESDSWFQHMVITPEYIWENAKIAIEREKQTRLENEAYAKERTAMLENCLNGINEKDGKWLTYCQKCHWRNAISFIEDYNQLIEGRDRYKPVDSKYVEPIDNGYEEEFAYLEENFGDEYKITYNQKSEEVVDIGYMASFGDIYYRSATNANIAPEDYMSNLSGILSEYKVADRDKIDCAMNYKSTIDGTNTLDVSMVDRVFKLELEFTVSGTKEVTFEKEIWVVHEGVYEVPFEYRDGEEPSFEHIIIDPAYIVESVKESENGK